jgi:hypothetical protein
MCLVWHFVEALAKGNHAAPEKEVEACRQRSSSGFTHRTAGKRAKSLSVECSSAWYSKQ